MRGLTAADVTADFFLVSNGHFDRYNLDRVALVRGPNSILFGLGSPAGILNYTTKKATFGENFGELGTRFDNFGSIRGSLDLNHVLLEDKLAVRVMGVYDDEASQFDHTYDHDKRGTVAFTFAPTENTVIRANLEDITISARRPAYNPPTDMISGWVAAGRPTYSPADSVGVNPGPAFGGLIGADSNPAQFFTNMNETVPDYMTQLENRREDGSRLPSRQRIRFLRSLNPDAATNFFVDPQVSDPDIFPLFDYDVTALPGSWQTMDGKRKSIVLTHNFTDKFTVEIGYADDEAVNDRHTQIIGQQNAIQIDVNETLPNGTVNQNFLRPFIFGRGVGRFTEDKAESFRAQFSWEFDFEDFQEDSFFGRHRLSGLYTENTFERWTYAWEQRANGFNGPFTTTLDNANRRVHGIWYVGPAFTSSMDKPVINQMPQVGRQLGQQMPYNYFVSETGQWVTADGQALERMVHRNAGWDIRDTEGIGFALQSFWWDDKIVTTVGWRDDEVTASATSFPTPGPDGLWSLDRDDWSFNNPPVSDGDETVTKGVVVHPTDWLSLHYNESENFVVSSPQVDILGRPIPGSSGEGKDYGVSFTLVEDKLFAKVNWYETAQRNAPSGGLAFVAFWRMRGFERGLFSRIDNGTITGVDWVNWDGTTNQYDRFPNVGDVNDYEAEGMEIELTYNPTPNWRIMFNAAKQETIQNNTGLAMLEYIELRQPFWDQLWDQEWSSTRTVGQQYNNAVGSRLFPAIAANGRISLAQAKWTWNAITNYQFNEGKMKGAAVGLSARWSDRRALGYALTSDADGNPITDLDSPFFGPSNLNVGVHASYRKKLFDDKIDWKIQLNIRNLVGDDRLVESRINPDGRVGAWKIGREEMYLLSNTFKF